ncbi:MAG: hypothetical protein U9N30_07650 [Campylobacterota bacterium]|nr:hypothetical protein [Campylobacterota bacterium]
MKMILKILSFFMILALFYGCTGPNLGSIGKQKVTSPIVSDNIVLMPHDASKVILAISSKILRTNRVNKNVTFNSVMKSDLLNARLFNFKEARLLQYDYQQNIGQKNLVADVILADSLGRTAAYTINATYSLNGAKIAIEKYTAVPKYLPVEKTVCFVLPANEYKMLKSSMLPKSFYKMYNYAASRAVTPIDAKKYSKKEDWVVMVFFMDRVSKSAIIEVGLSDKDDKFDRGYKKETTMLNYDGWKVGTLMGNYHLMQLNSTQPLYIKAFYIPGSESGDNIFMRRAKMVGLYKVR